MENKLLKYLFSFILCGVLFVSEILLIIQYNASRGITKEEINNIIDSVNIEKETLKFDEYKELEKEINPEILQNIIRSKELEIYVKENSKIAYSNILYDEDNIYISSEELKNYINNTLTEQELTEEEKENINKKVDEFINRYEQGLENAQIFKNNIKIISSFMSKTATTIMLGISILIGLVIILINKSKEGYIFVGITTLIVGVIFFILWLSLSKTIYTTGIDKDVIRFVNMYLPTLLNTLKKSSIITSLIGLIGCITYTILHYQEVQSNGEI
jgi:lipopolysaccharide export LptBFGC system permease protein LptF